jgi:hypothetical protein
METMCLKSRFATREEVEQQIPGDEFYCYKIVVVSGDNLVSPAYSQKKWHTGIIRSSGIDRNNGDSGIYVFLAPIGIKLQRDATGWTHAHGGDRILRVKCRREDVVWAGQDKWSGVEGTCFVMRKVEVLEEDFKNALDPDFLQAEVNEIIAQAEKTAKKAKKRATKATAKAKKTVEKTKKKSAKRTESSKKKAKKTIERAKKKLAKKKAEPTGYDKLSRDDLEILAKAKKIKGYSTMNRKQLISMLKK